MLIEFVKYWFIFASTTWIFSSIRVIPYLKGEYHYLSTAISCILMWPVIALAGILGREMLINYINEEEE